MSKIRVLVQAGHIAPREPGFESGTGTAGEQEFVRKVRDLLCDLLTADGRFYPIPQPGDIQDGITVDAALFLHADGSANPAASGFSFGYPPYTVNRDLAELIRSEFEKIPGHPPHHRDNYTGDMSHYYGFRKVESAGPEVLVEHGFLTNPGERLWLNANILPLAQAEYRALLRYFNLPSRSTKPDWYDRASTLEPLWAWMLWRDNGAPADWRPKQIPARVPAWWWARWALHRGRA